MPTREFRYALISWMASVAFHAGGWTALAWSLAKLTNPEFSLDRSPHTGEITSLMTVAATEQTTEALDIAQIVEETVAVEVPDLAKPEDVEALPAPSAAWADDRLSHRPIVVRERLPRTVAMANLAAVQRPSEPARSPDQPQPHETPKICQELWRRTTELPKQIDFDAVEKLLKKVSAATTAVIETDSAVASTASVQGTKVDALPKPGPRNKPPVYPSAARLAGQSGRALLTVVVAVDGSAKDVRLTRSSGHPALDDAALEAVRSWRFEPAKRNGVAVELEIDVPIRFRLTP